MCHGLLDPDLYGSGSINKQKMKKTYDFLFCDFFVFLSLTNDLNVTSKRKSIKT
jgi:hypothetical protein